jgi:alkanesulfonate monooxygenase SsuD/methylene tetrahydromethanopterin reductase-like flavin-dependent oxidoreductase (luciferase family)
MAQEIELGLDTFGDIQAGPDGQPLSLAQVIRNVVDEGVLADQSGVFCIGLGKHHWPDFAISSPEALLAVIGARTKHIRINLVTRLGWLGCTIGHVMQMKCERLCKSGATTSIA